jgi:hypothetical protein
MYEVWFRTADWDKPKLFMCDLPLNIARRVADGRWITTNSI